MHSWFYPNVFNALWYLNTVLQTFTKFKKYNIFLKTQNIFAKLNIDFIHLMLCSLAFNIYTNSTYF